MQNVSIEEAEKLDGRLEKFALSLPDVICLLPQNFETAQDIDEFVWASQTPTVRALLRNAGLAEGHLTNSTAARLRAVNRSADWIAPAIFISWPVLSQNANIVSVVLNLISSYLFELFSGATREPEVELEVIVETSSVRQTKRLTYKGPVSGLGILQDAVKEITNGDR